MKTLNVIFALLLATVLVAFTTAQQTYKVDAASSKMKWKGTKVTGAHEGYIKLGAGSVTVNNNKITGGTFDIDMTTMTCTDLADANYNAKLIGHLKSDDFFSVEKFKTAKFVITKVTEKSAGKYDITGKLTIKGITNEIVIPADVKMKDKTLEATAAFKIDRTKWDIKYNSGNFFENLGDKVIYNDIEFNLELVAKL